MVQLLTDGTATLSSGALTGLLLLLRHREHVTALNFILTGGNTFTDLSSNVDALDISVNSLQSSVTLLDASMAFVEQTGFVRMRKTTAVNNTISNVPNTSASAWTQIDLRY